MANPLIGKTVVSVDLARDKKAIRFNLADGGSVTAYADGDCCSDTWIESLDAPDNLIGTVAVAESLDMSRPDIDRDGDVTAFYGFKIVTEKGDCVIDYRNSSNGYYGGNLVWDKEADYYYGGVYGQNISKEEWEKVV